MKRHEITVGMLLWAWTSLWGEHIIRVTRITESRPARVYGVIVMVLKRPYGHRANTIMLGREMDFGIACVRLLTDEQANRYREAIKSVTG